MAAFNRGGVRSFFTLILFGFFSWQGNWFGNIWAGGALTTSGLDTTWGGAEDRVVSGWCLVSYSVLVGSSNLSWCWYRWR